MAEEIVDGSARTINTLRRAIQDVEKLNPKATKSLDILKQRLESLDPLSAATLGSSKATPPVAESSPAGIVIGGDARTINELQRTMRTVAFNNPEAADSITHFQRQLEGTDTLSSLTHGAAPPQVQNNAAPSRPAAPSESDPSTIPLP